MITDAKLSDALDYLAKTDQESAELKADVERKEYVLKRTKALAFKLAEGTVADRNAIAETSGDVGTAAEDWFKAIEKCEAVRAQRQTKALIVEVWRSMNANRRVGNV